MPDGLQISSYDYNYIWKKIIIIIWAPIIIYQTKISLENEDPQRPLRPRKKKILIYLSILWKLLVLFFLINKTVQFKQIMVK